jgi:N-acyl-D-amino-acid deacylase
VSASLNRVMTIGAVLSLLVAFAPAGEPAYDLLIRNGRVVDGSGNPWFVGDVAVQGDRIAAVGRVPFGTARREIDAAGLVVAPGFIDMHSHSDLLLLEDGNAQSKVRQGVTTEVLGEGRSAGPLKGKLKPRGVSLGGRLAAWDSLGGYLTAVEQAGVAVNVASYVGLDNLWEGVMGPPTSGPRPRSWNR